MTRSDNIAIFDLDYTLTIKGTWGRFIASTVKDRPQLWLPILWAMAKNQYLYKRGKIPRCGVKMAMIKLAIAGWEAEKVEAYALEFVKKEVECGLRPGGLVSLEAHRAAGDTLVIASAAVDFIVAPVCEILDIEHYVATKAAWHNNRLLDSLGSENCYGAEKLSRMQAYLRENSALKQKHTKITMYSDSHSDLDILLWADEGVAVDPDRKLLALAKAHNIPVVNWL